MSDIDTKGYTTVQVEYLSEDGDTLIHDKIYEGFTPPLPVQGEYVYIGQKYVVLNRIFIYLDSFKTLKVSIFLGEME